MQWPPCWPRRELSPFLEGPFGLDSGLLLAFHFVLEDDDASTESHWIVLPRTIRMEPLPHLLDIHGFTFGRTFSPSYGM